MTTIVYIKQKDFSPQQSIIETDLTIGEWILEKYEGTNIAYSVFDGEPCKENDITFNIDQLVNGVFQYTVIETPSTGVEVAVWIAIAAFAVSIALVAMLPKIKTPSNQVRDTESPNNQLSSRSNRARPLARIPQIKGTVKSIPDIIQPTFLTYQDFQTKVEHSYYCVGYGPLDIEKISDGDSEIINIESASVQVYGPNKSPNNSAPDIQIGEFIDELIVTPYKSNEIDGIELPFINQVGKTPVVIDNNGHIGIDGIGLYGLISQVGTTFILSLQKKFSPDWLSPDYYVGNTITLENYIVLDMVYGGDYNMSGYGEIIDVVHADGNDNYSITIKPITIVLPPFAPSTIGYVYNGGSSTTKFSTPYNQWYYMSKDLFDSGFVNINAPEGLYKDTGGVNLHTITVGYQLEVETVDENNSPNNDAFFINGSISGNSTINRGITEKFTLPTASRFRIRVIRTTENYTGAVQQKIVLEDIYGLVNVDLPHFGNVTTIQTKTIPTKSALSVKERQLNCLATEKLYKYLGSGEFDSVLTNNSSAIQSYINDFISPVMGRRELEELDADNMLNLESDIVAYFGDPSHLRFDYTLDSLNTTFEEYSMMLFNAINCIPFREGTQMKAKFEKLDRTPSLLFTHRSKLPGSEKYTRNFNQSQINDGVELTYVSPETNTNEIIYLPADKTAKKPKKIEIPGIRNYNQAFVRANREYNKIKYQKIAFTVDTTAEGRYVKPWDLISIVKGSRINTTDGEIFEVSPDGLTLTLSQDVAFEPGENHYILLKRDDGSIESILCYETSISNEVLLEHLPDEQIKTGIDFQRKTEFNFGSDSKLGAELYLPTEINVKDNYTCSIGGINFDERYYEADNTELDAFDDSFSEEFA